MDVIRCRKRPVEGQAVQLTEDADWEEIARWCGGEVGDGVPKLLVPIGGGWVAAYPGWWVVKDADDRFTAVHPSTFAQTYEPADLTKEETDA